MDVYNVAFADWRNIARCIILVVVVLIDYGDNLLFRQVGDVRIATDVERAGLSGCNAVDDKVLLLVIRDKLGIVALADDGTDGYGGTGCEIS